MDFRMLGPVGLWDGADRVHLGPAEQPKVRCLLAVLLWTPGRAVSAASIDRNLWGDEPHSTETRYKYVQWLRKALSPYGFELVSAHDSYRLKVRPEQVDVHRFRTAAGTARTLIGERAFAAARAELRAALALWTGPALQGVPGAWAEGLRNQLDRQHREVTTRHYETEVECGAAEEVLTEVVGWAGEHHSDESVIRLLMRTLYLAGNYGEALDAYRGLAARLGAEPGRATRTLLDRIRVRDPLLEPAATAAVVPRQLPAVTAHFAGRTRELRRLDQIADPAREHAPVVSIYGSAGVGKTTLAVHWGQSAAARFPHGQLYADLRGHGPAETARDPAEVLSGFLAALDVSSDRIPADPEEQGKLFRSLVADRRLLVVLDNAADVAQVRPLLPGTSSCLTLVTSRVQLGGLHVAPGAETVTLDLLDDAESRALLAGRLGVAWTGTPAVDELIRLCACLPLALSIVAAQAAVPPGLPAAKIVEQLRPGRLDALATSDASTDPRVVFSWSVRRLSDPAARLFRLLAAHPGPDFAVPAAAALTGASPAGAAAALAELATAHLVSSPRPQRYAMHDLLHDYAAETAGDGLRAAEIRLLDHYLHTASVADKLIGPYSHTDEQGEPADGVPVLDFADDAAAMAWFRAEALALAAVTDQALRTGLPRYALLIPRMTATFQSRQGRWRELRDAQDLSLAGALELGDTDREADAHANIGRVLGWTGELAGAQEHLRLATRLAGDADRAYRFRTTSAWLLGLQDKPAEALLSAQEALRAARSAGNGRGTAVALNEVGWWHAQTGDFAEAKHNCELALRLFEELPDPAGIAAANDSLGFVYHRLGDLGAALEHYGRALAEYERQQDVYEQAATLDRIGDTRRAAGDPGAATAAWRRSLELFNQISHPDGAAVSDKLTLT